MASFVEVLRGDTCSFSAVGGMNEQSRQKARDASDVTGRGVASGSQTVPFVVCWICLCGLVLLHPVRMGWVQWLGHVVQDITLDVHLIYTTNDGVTPRDMRWPSGAAPSFLSSRPCNRPDSSQLVVGLAHRLPRLPRLLLLLPLRNRIEHHLAHPSAFSGQRSVIDLAPSSVVDPASAPASLVLDM